MATIVVTGASAGIGAAGAVELTRRGHEVIATGRSGAKLDEVRRRMEDAAPAGTSVPASITADLSSLVEVRRLADEVQARTGHVDVLVNNAGLQTRTRETSPDGFELVLAVNHLAPFLLTNLLLETIRASGGRVVTTSSSVQRSGRIDFDDVQMEQGWSGLGSYSRSKLANLWFTSELASRAGIPASCFHPGAINTHLGREVAADVQPKLQTVGRFLMNRFGRSPEQGADTLVWLATGPEGGAPRAVYYQNRKPVRLTARAQDAASATRLWEVSAALVGL